MCGNDATWHVPQLKPLRVEETLFEMQTSHNSQKQGSPGLPRRCLQLPICWRPIWTDGLWACFAVAAHCPFPRCVPIIPTVHRDKHNSGHEPIPLCSSPACASHQSLHLPPSAWVHPTLGGEQIRDVKTLRRVFRKQISLQYVQTPFAARAHKTIYERNLLLEIMSHLPPKCKTAVCF